MMPAQGAYGSPEWAAEWGAQAARAIDKEPPAVFNAYVKTYLQAAKDASDFLGKKGTAAYVNDETALTNHAATMRTIGAYLTLLEGGLIPALEIDGENPNLRTWAAQTVGGLETHIKLMRYQLEHLEQAA